MQQKCLKGDFRESVKIGLCNPRPHRKEISYCGGSSENEYILTIRIAESHCMRDHHHLSAAASNRQCVQLQ